MGGQYHHELIKYCPPILNVLCVSSHFWPFTIEKFVLEKLDKSLGSADPPPQLGQNPKFFQKFDLKAPLILSWSALTARRCFMLKVQAGTGASRGSVWPIWNQGGAVARSRPTLPSAQGGTKRVRALNGKIYDRQYLMHTEGRQTMESWSRSSPQFQQQLNFNLKATCQN